MNVPVMLNILQWKAAPLDIILNSIDEKS